MGKDKKEKKEKKSKDVERKNISELKKENEKKSINLDDLKMDENEVSELDEDEKQDDENTDDNKKSEKRDYGKEFIDLIKDLAVIVIIVLIIRTFLVMPFQINGQSMYDSYYDREFIIVDRFSYIKIPVIKKWAPDRWDVIVFKPHVSRDKEYFIKRIIGLPWDIVKIDNWKVYLFSDEAWDFEELHEWYLSDSNKDSTFVRWATWEVVYHVPENSFFVMWDNRNASTDSRTCFSSCAIEGKTNFITKWDITWRVFLDLGYYNIVDYIKVNPLEIKFGTFSFIHPQLWIDTHPRWFSSPSSYQY